MSCKSSNKEHEEVIGFVERRRTFNPYQKGFTLIELMVVVVIIGVLAALAVPNLTAVREKTLDKEATAALRLVLVAERQYRLATNNYWPSAAVTNSNIDQINGNLSLVLASSNWAYRVRVVAGGASFTANASRQNRNWTITNSATTPVFSGTCY